MGTVTTYDYYPNGLLKSKTIRDKVTSFRYDSLGRQIEVCETYGIGTKDCYVRKYCHDKLGRVIDEICCSADGEVHTHTSYAYDVGGNLYKVHVHTKEGIQTTTSTFNSHGVATKITDPLGNITTTHCKYDYKNAMGQIVGNKEVTDAEGNVTVVIEDALGRVVTVFKKDAFGKVTEQKEHFYDVSGNCCKIIDKVIAGECVKEIITATIFDTMGRPTTHYQAYGLPEQKVTSFAYNPAGSKTKTEKFDGIIIAYKHDALGRVSEIFSSDKTIDYRYTYDLNDNVINITDKINNVTTSKKYDCYNFLVQETLGNGQSFVYTNDLMGRILNVTLSDGTGISYDYDGIQLKSISRVNENGGCLYQHGYDEYDLNGKVVQMTMAGDVGPVKYSYDKCGRIISIDAGSWKQTIDGYDKSGNIIAKSTVIDGEIQSYNYSYDPLYQLVQEEGPVTHNYAYDSHYNRLAKDGMGCTYNSLDLLINDGENSYTYDRNGNLISKNNVFFYEYDAFDRLVAMVEGETRTCYKYDESHRRLSKVVYEKVADSGKSKVNSWKEVDRINFLYQGQNDIGAVGKDGKIAELRLLGIGKGAEIGAAVAMEIQGVMYVPLHDHNGNVAGLVEGKNGAVVQSYVYNAFGEYMEKEAAISPWLFSSKRYDPESGFVYFGRRYYDPATARWITEDPLGREAGPNRYAFVHNNPLTNVDLYGLMGQGNFSYMESFGRSMNRFYNGMSMIGGFLASLPGRAIEIAGTHLLPVPYIKDAVSFVGHCLSGKNPGTFVPDWKKPRSQPVTHEGYGDLNPLERHVFINGIMTSYKEFQDQLARISNELGGKTVYGVYNASHGFALDMVEVLCQKAGISTHSVNVAESTIRGHLSEMDKHSTNGVINMYAHSQGAEIVHNLSHEVRQRMVVTGLGPARVLSPQNFKDAQNFSTKNDFVPFFADTIGYFRGTANGYLTILKPHGISPLANHGIAEPAYAGVIANQGENYRKTVGSVENLGYQ